MSELPDIDISAIRIGQRVRFFCPDCGFSFVHTWLSLDGSRFSTSSCYMHDPMVAMSNYGSPRLS